MWGSNSRTFFDVLAMADKPDQADKDLLDRLNALKPSTVQLERQRYESLQ